MKASLALAALLVATGLPTSVFAQESTSSADVPPPRVGFQMALRTGWAVPMGKASGAPGDDLSQSFSGEVPFLVEIGGKPIPGLFLGGYLGFGFGGTEGSLGAACHGGDVTCVAYDVRFGAEIQYHILPYALANPWVGYGIGLESTGISVSSNGQSGSITASGFEYAHFMGGVDFRISRVFGLGPYVDFAMGEYTHSHSEFPNSPTRDVDIDNKATHEWLALGVRGTFFP